MFEASARLVAQMRPSNLQWRGLMARTIRAHYMYLEQIKQTMLIANKPTQELLILCKRTSGGFAAFLAINTRLL